MGGEARRCTVLAGAMVGPLRQLDRLRRHRAARDEGERALEGFHRRARHLGEPLCDQLLEPG